MSTRASNLISIPCWDSFNEWVRRFLVHSLIHNVVFLLSFLLNQGEDVFFPFPLETARTADFDFCQWFARVVFPRNFLIPFMPCLKISFFLPMSLLSSRLFCFRFSLSISFSALLFSSVRRAFHLSCCLTNFWKVGLRWRNPKP